MTDEQHAGTLQRTDQRHDRSRVINVQPIDDGIRLTNRRHQQIGIVQLADNRLDAALPERIDLVGRADQAADLMAECHQLLCNGTTDIARRAGDKNFISFLDVGLSQKPINLSSTRTDKFVDQLLRKLAAAFEQRHRIARLNLHKACGGRFTVQHQVRFKTIAHPFELQVVPWHEMENVELLLPEYRHASAQPQLDWPSAL